LIFPAASGCGIGINRGSADGCDFIYRGDGRSPPPANRHFIAERESLPGKRPAALPREKTAAATTAPEQTG
jgi:hypothetical protein